MHPSTILTALASATLVSSHALMWGVSVNGVDQGDGRSNYIRSPPNDSPIRDMSSPEMVCNVNGATPAPSFVSAAPGSKITFEWYHDNRDDDIIDPSHEGPIITHIAPYTSGAATGPIWTKIAEEGFSGGKWAVDRLIANRGKIDVSLPDLAAGKYLLRQEIIALHEADGSYPERGAQFYPSCVQLEVTGQGSVTLPKDGFDISSYSAKDPGIFFDLYAPYNSYSIPGPKVATFQGGSGGGGGGQEGGSPTVPTNPEVTEAPSPTTPPIAPSTVPTTLATSVRRRPRPTRRPSWRGRKGNDEEEEEENEEEE